PPARPAGSRLPGGAPRSARPAVEDYTWGHYQLGFTDGSWMPVFFPRTVRDRFAALYPHARHWKAPLPDVLAGPAAQGRP
ncbi:hypothetical protein, partial [Streptomyces sp. NPDC054786]